MKEQYEDVQRFGKYHPDYHKIMKEIRQQKRQLDLNELVANLKLAENDFQDLLDEISLIIGKSVSEAVKVPVSNPFLHQIHHVEPAVEAVEAAPARHKNATQLNLSRFLLLWKLLKTFASMWQRSRDQHCVSSLVLSQNLYNLKNPISNFQLVLKFSC